QWRLQRLSTSFSTCVSHVAARTSGKPCPTVATARLVPSALVQKRMSCRPRIRRILAQGSARAAAARPPAKLSGGARLNEELKGAVGRTLLRAGQAQQSRPPANPEARSRPFFGSKLTLRVGSQGTSAIDQEKARRWAGS